MTHETATGRLLENSVRVILDGQSVTGAYIASPNFPNYRFGWLRDGSFCALAMDAVGKRESAGAFHRWVASVVQTHSARIGEIVRQLHEGVHPDEIDMLPTRYTLDGRVEDEQDEVWPNFQLDGYGTWLFALEAHFGPELPIPIRAAAELVVDYIVASWQLPCFDYWEEFGDRRHTSTLAALAAGLLAASRTLARPGLSAVAEQILETIESQCMVDGHFVKGPEDDRVDASLLSLSTPFDLFSASHPAIRATVSELQGQLLSPSGGLRRYRGDTFYGGNPWLMLTAWLGWHARRADDPTVFRSAVDWVESRADANGQLAEQVLDEPQDVALVDYWVTKWGPVADPLLWSHAQYILMITEVEKAV